MRIVIDAMGGDNAPAAVVEGAVLAACEYEIEVLLAGQREVVQEILKESLRKHDLGKGKVEVISASQVVLMHESPTEAVRRKKDSSIAVAAKYFHNTEVENNLAADLIIE